MHFFTGGRWGGVGEVAKQGAFVGNVKKEKNAHFT